MISKACKYGIRATIFIASKRNPKVKPGVKEIAREIDAPEAFTAKILQLLNKKEIITSVKGPYGGFLCEDFQLQFPVIKIVEAIDGLAFFRECGLHFEYAKSRDQLLKTFQETSVESLAGNLNQGKVYVNNL